MLCRSLKVSIDSTPKSSDATSIDFFYALDHILDMSFGSLREIVGEGESAQKGA